MCPMDIVEGTCPPASLLIIPMIYSVVMQRETVTSYCVQEQFLEANYEHSIL